MATSESIVEALSRSLLPRHHHSYPCTNNSSPVHALKLVNNTRKWSKVHVQVNGYPRMLHNCRRTYGSRWLLDLFHLRKDASRLESMGCKCRHAEIFCGGMAEDQNETQSMGEAFRPRSAPVYGISSATDIEESEVGKQFKHENGGLFLDGMSTIAGTVKDHKYGETLEDEAWNLLRDSIVYYCNKPIGTIAAKDPGNTSILNYDQVFIRDFIPSGIAFLLKGEYEIVRNFILYTLQLQVIF